MLIRAFAITAFVLVASVAHAADLADPARVPAAPTTPAEAAANQRESDAYGRLVKASPGFRSGRVRLECDPIEDAALKAQCVDSFKN